MQRAKRILALVLAFTLVASFCVTGAAADDTVQGDYVTVNVETGSYRNTLTVNVYGPEGNWLETLTSERARTSDCEISINLIDTEYLMEDVDFNGDGSIAAIAATAISSDRKSYNIRWNGSGGGGQSFTLDVYLRVNPTGTPETPEGTYNEGATVGFRAYTPQMLKLLYCENPALVNDSTEITGVEMFFRREFGYGQSEGLADINREEDYRNTELSNATGLATPSNVSEIRISYRNGETEGVASIEAGDLSFVYHSGAGHYYSIESRNHGINVVYFYNETGSHSGNNFFQYAVRFVETGNSLGTNMPNDPTYTDGAVNNYSFVNWEQGSWNGSGDPFYSTTVVNDDLTVFAMKVGWNDHSTTQIWVMNPDEEFMELVADKAGVSRTDINKSSIKIRVYDDDEQTNENYPDNGWVDAYDGYYLVWNHRGEGGTGSYEEGHLEPDKIDSVTVYFQLNDSDEVQEVNLGVGADGELGKSLRGNENILQLKVRDDGYTPTYYNVGYSWTFSGTGTRPSVTLPVDSTSYDSEAEAKAAVDTTYTSASTASVEGGTWTFSGWNNGTLNGTTVTFSGTWTFTPDGGGEEPENPPKPGDDEIPGILGAEFRVNVVCETNGGHSVSYPVMANAEGTTRYMVSDVAGDAESGYSCTVTFTDIYLNTYLANNTGHTDSDTPDDASVTLSWDAAEEAWELDPADNTATFYVECESGGGEPEYQTINYHIVGDVQPEDDENWTDGNMSVKVEKGTEYSFAEAPEIAGYTFDGWYEKAADIGDEGKKATSPITVGDKKYELYGSYSANTYRLTYDGNGGSFTNEWGTHTQTNEEVTYAKLQQLYNTTFYFVREGYTCIGWSTDPDSTTAEFGGGAWVVFDDNTFPGLSSRGSVTLYAVWEKDEPTEEELIGPEGILADSVKLVCDRVDRHNCLFDLKRGTAEIGESVRGADGVLTCEVEVAVEAYLADYNTKGQGTHTLAAGEASEKTITLRFDEDQESWVSATGLPIIFNVHCQPEKPDGEDVAAALEGFKVWVECENDEAGHTYQRKDYTVNADDTGERYDIGEVTGDADNGYGCTVTIRPDVYVQRFGEMNGNTAHTLTADSPQSFEIELVYTDTGWALAENEPSSTTFYVECETETEPEGPEKPTVSDLDLEYVVRIECVNAENTHGSDSVDFSLRTDTQIGEPYLEDGSWKVTVTVDGRDYLAGYATDTWSGVEHELAPGETAEKTFEAVYDGTGWTVDATPAVTFRVVCDTTGDEGDEPAITGFSKRLVTSEPTWADFSRLGISYPDARGVIHVDRYDSVTLLYTLTVSGDEGAKYLINDPDAMLVTFRDGVASVWEPATDVYGEFTGTVPSPHTYYVVKTFSWADIRDSGGYLSNTAIVEPMDGTGGPDGGNGESSETVKVEIDGDWYPVVKPGRPSALTDEHVAYMIGYADGTVRPLSGITRAEVATIFFRLLTDEVRDEYWSQRNPYTDVAEDAWYNNAISTLVNMGIISGYSDGTFRPDAAITRAEFTKIAVSFFDYADDGYSGRFSDVSGGSWYATFVDAAADMGLIEGYGDGTFRPDAGITRAEACAIVNRTLGRAPEAGHLLPRSEMNTWSDNANANAWYYADIQEATNSHDYEWVTYGGERIENWTAKLAERDWADLEREWSDAHDAPGGEVMS